MYTILGAGGAIANEISKVLALNNIPHTLVGRNPKPLPGAFTKSADINDPVQTSEVIKGSSVVFLCVGLKYDLRIWEKQWPVIMTNVINACKTHQAKLIFFDNVYMLGKVSGHMTETTPDNPVSKKGSRAFKDCNSVNG